MAFNYTVNWVELTNATSSIYLDVFLLIFLMFLPYVIFAFKPSKFTARLSFFVAIFGWIFSHFWTGRTLLKIAMLTKAISDISIAVTLQNLLAFLTTFESIINLIYGTTILLWGLLWIVSYIPEQEKEETLKIKLLKALKSIIK